MAVAPVCADLCRFEHSARRPDRVDFGNGRSARSGYVR